MRSRRDEHGQTMPLVLGIILVLTLGTVVLVQNTFQQFPIVTKDVIQHEAYRAMVSGLDEYEYAVNANADFAACSAKFVNGSGTTIGTSTLTGASSVCSALTFGSWISVPGSGAANGPPGWFLVDNPVINTATGNLSIDIVGAAGYPNSYNYQSAVVTLQPLNGFLLNVLWINYDQVDPAVVNQYGNNGTPTCDYYWTPNPDALGTNCQRLDFITADSLSGNLFVNDTIFVCGSPTFQNIQTADPTEMYLEGNGCSGTPTISGTQADNVGVQPIPTDNSSLSTQASLNGCLYEGPTTIVVNGSNMTVTSPDTPTGKPTGAPGTSTSNDALNDAANIANICLPVSPATTVPVPANGVIYVETCQSITNTGGVTKCNGQTYNPLVNAGETGTGGVTAGDAIVQGTVNSPVTIGSANNIVIDGNICYSDAVSGGACTAAPAAPSTNVLGLVANNYVEINHPVDNNGNNLSTCSQTLGAGTPTCDLSNPYIDAVILALNHSFLVNNYNTGNGLGTINLNGTIDQDWRGPVGTFNGGGGVATGYAKNYQYDQRLIYLSPPYYLNPGTSQWGFAAFTVAAGACKLATGSPNSAACTGYP
ncbi:MAG: hypothetical protein P4L86_09450 [Mycobacterium sp.]|nr:hypothetical protein [Mycobacterium sp.]